jgi:hypothetical protein
MNVLPQGPERKEGANLRKNDGIDRWLMEDDGGKFFTILREYPPAGGLTDGYPEVLNGNSGKHWGKQR